MKRLMRRATQGSQTGLIAIDYPRHGQVTLTLDRKMAALRGCERL